jgi:hypothetical protein
MTTTCFRRLTAATATLALASTLFCAHASACGGSIALTAADLGPGASVSVGSDDQKPANVNGTVGDAHAYQRYARLHFEDQFIETGSIPWPWDTGSAALMYSSYRYVTYRLTTFPTPREAQAAYRGDVAYLRTWCHMQQQGAQAECASGWMAMHPSSTYTVERVYKNEVLNAEVESRNSGPLAVVQATVARDAHNAVVSGLLKIVTLEIECDPSYAP